MEMIRIGGGFRGRSRRICIFLLAIVVPAALALGYRGTAWTVPALEASHAGYTLVGSWDGADVPSGEFFRPLGIAVAPEGDVYVTDGRLRVIRLSSSGTFKGEWGHEGNGPGEFGNPVGIAVAPDGSVFVSDYEQDRIHKFTPDGRFLLSFGVSGRGPGQFNAPAGLAVDPSGSLFVADFYNHRPECLLPRTGRRFPGWGDRLRHRSVRESNPDPGGRKTANPSMRTGRGKEDLRETILPVHNLKKIGG